jgi:hypothetical protein
MSSHACRGFVKAVEIQMDHRFRAHDVRRVGFAGEGDSRLLPGVERGRRQLFRSRNVIPEVAKSERVGFFRETRGKLTERLTIIS